MRQFHVHRIAPIADQVDFYERTGGIDVADLGTKGMATVGLLLDLQKMGTDKHHRGLPEPYNFVWNVDGNVP